MPDPPTWREVNEELHIKLPDEDYDTFSGFVWGEINRVPARRGELLSGGLRSEDRSEKREKTTWWITLWSESCRNRRRRNPRRRLPAPSSSNRPHITPLSTGGTENESESQKSARSHKRHSFLHISFLRIYHYGTVGSFPQIQEEYNASDLTDEHLQPGANPEGARLPATRRRPPFPPAFRNFCGFPAVLFFVPGELLMDRARRTFADRLRTSPLSLPRFLWDLFVRQEKDGKKRSPAF